MKTRNQLEKENSELKVKIDELNDEIRNMSFEFDFYKQEYQLNLSETILLGKYKEIIKEQESLIKELIAKIRFGGKK